MAATINTRQLMLESATFRSTVTEVAITVPTISEFIKLETTGLLSPASITLSAIAYNTTSPSYSWERRSNDPTVTAWTVISGATSSTLVVNNTDYSTYLGTKGTQVSFRVTCRDTSNTGVISSTATQVITYSDESKDAIVVSNSAPNTIVICDVSGTPTSLNNTGIKLQVSKNGTFLTYNTSGDPNTWSIGTPTQNPISSVTLGTGSVTDSTLSYTYSNIAGLTADEVLVTFPITVINSQGIARSVVNTTQKFVKNKPGSTYELTIIGGVRSFTYDQAGANPTPAATSYSVTLTQNGSAVTPTSYSWTTGGQLTGTGTGTTFTPSLVVSFSGSANTFVQCTVVFAGNTITRTIPITISKVGTTGIDGKTYELTINGGIRSFTYDKDGLFPIPAPTAYSVTLVQDGTTVTPSSYNWTTSGQLSSTGTGSTFTPVVAASFSGTNTFVQCTVVYAGNTFTRTIPINISRIGATGNNGKTYELTITGGVRSFTYNQAGASPSPSATAYSVTLTEDGTAVTPSSYEWTTGGQLTSTSAAATFTPTVAGAFISSSNTFVQCKVVYAGISVTRSIPIAINRTGSTGAKTVQISAYQWSSTGLPTLPTTSFDYTWSNGTKTPSTLDNGWSFTAGAPSANNQTLYEIVKLVTESNGEAAQTTGITFSGASSNSIGFRQDGTIGTSVKNTTGYLYYQFASAASPTDNPTPTYGANPYNFTTGVLTITNSTYWSQSPPTFQAGTSSNNYWYRTFSVSQTDTNAQVVTLGSLTLGTSFTNLVTFTSLSTPGSTTIDGANITTGTINANRITTTNLSAINSNLGLVNIGASGSSLGYVKTLSRNYGDTSAGFFLGYDSTAYKFEISNSDRSKLFQFNTAGDLQIKGVDIFGGRTGLDTGTGFFLGSSGSFSVGTGLNSLRFDGTTLTVPAINITGTIPATVTHSGNVTGTLNGDPVGTVVGNASDGATAFTGTAAYRTNSAPTNNGVFGSITQANTADGNVVVTVNYTYTQGANIADSLILFYREGGGTVVAADPAFITNAVSGYITFTLKPGTTYTFGIQAVRRTESGLVGIAITTSSSITTNTANYTGNINNIAASTVQSGAANGDSALSAVNNASTGLSARLNKTANDVLNSTITLSTTGTALVGAPNDGLYISGTYGLLAKKSGATTFQITTAGDATFSGTVSVGTTIPVITGSTISSGAGALITSTGNFAVGNTTTNLVWNGTSLNVTGGFRVDNTSGYINLTSSLGGVILDVDDNNLGQIASSGSLRVTNRAASSTCINATAQGTGVTYGVLGGVTGAGANFGVDGSSTSTSGTGVRGRATASTGTTYGVIGTSSSSSGVGVDGTGGLRGVVGTCNTNAFAGQGVRGVGTGNSTQGSTGILATSPYMALEVSGPSYFSGGNIQILANTFFKTGYSYSFENVQGTAPFAVASTTKVTNLQADSVDGLEIVGVAANGTGTANFGNTTKPTATTTNNVWLQVTHNGTTYYIPAWT